MALRDLIGDLANISLTVQGIFFIISIVLVWYQLRESTRLVRAANTQKLVELTTPFNLQLARDRELMGLWWQGAQHFDQLDAIDQARYMNLLGWYLTLHENIYHQWRSQLIDRETFDSWTRELEFFTRQQQLSTVWPRLNSYYESSFSQHVTAIIARLAQETA